MGGARGPLSSECEVGGEFDSRPGSWQPLNRKLFARTMNANLQAASGRMLGRSIPCVRLGSELLRGSPTRGAALQFFLAEQTVTKSEAHMHQCEGKEDISRHCRYCFCMR